MLETAVIRYRNRGEPPGAAKHCCSTQSTLRGGESESVSAKYSMQPLTELTAGASSSLPRNPTMNWTENTLRIAPQATSWGWQQCSVKNTRASCSICTSESTASNASSSCNGSVGGRLRRGRPGEAGEEGDPPTEGAARLERGGRGGRGRKQPASARSGGRSGGRGRRRTSGAWQR